MDELLRASKTRRTSASNGELTPAKQSIISAPAKDLVLNTPDDVRKLLKSKPDECSLMQCLKWLDSHKDPQIDFDIKLPGSLAAQIINVLVNDVITDFWPVWTLDHSSDSLQRQNSLLRCLRSIAGTGAIVARLRAIISTNESNLPKFQLQTYKYPPNHMVKQLIDFLERLLEGKSTLQCIWDHVYHSSLKQPQQALMWTELVSLLASGKLLSAVAEGQDLLRHKGSGADEASWLGNGRLYSAWLGHNIYVMVTGDQMAHANNCKAAAQFLSRSLTLGYTEQIIDKVFAIIISGRIENLEILRTLFYSLTTHEQKSVLYTMIRLVAARYYLNIKETAFISGLAAMISSLVSNRSYLQDGLVTWLTGVSGNEVSAGTETRRAVIATLATQSDLIRNLLSKALQQFGDTLYIKHTPALHQEVNVQVLLITMGHAFRSDPDYVRSLTRSSLYLQAISNRLASSSERSQFLGMIVGCAVSELVDSADKRMRFSVKELEGDEGQRLRGLCRLRDGIGSLDDLNQLALKEALQARKDATKSPKKGVPSSPVETPATSTIASTGEFRGERASDGELLLPYGKPDSDEEDDDDDATLVRRNKPTAPVYIRDLMMGLRDGENYDRYRLALMTASSLIRRKANFGAEVSDHIEELATILVGLDDKYSMEDFQTLRLQSMIAVLAASPLQMGRWFSRTYFNGDYSMSQRASILTTISLGAREMAGYAQEDAVLTGAITAPENLFPSQILPGKYDEMCVAEAAAVTAIAKELERTIIQPMAIESADKLAGPNVLKIRTFSSRMEVEKKRKKPIANELAKIVAEGFFFPLTTLWRIQTHIRSTNGIFSHPFLLTHFLKTLSIVLNASGPSTLSLPALTTEFWSILLSLRTIALSAPPILEALLFSVLTLLELNSNNQRALVEDHAKELLETQAWAELVFEKVGAGSEEGDRIRMLTAGVLMRTKEVVEKYQRLLMGDLVDFI